MKVIIDAFKLAKPPVRALIVSSQATYVKSRKVLLNFYLTGNEEYSVLYVTDHPYINWYNDQQETLEKITPTSLLLGKHPTTVIPQSLTDNDIIQLNLLDLAIEPNEKEIVRHFLGLLFSPQVTAAELANFLYQTANTVAVKRKAFKSNFLENIWRKKISKSIAEFDTTIRQLFQPVIDLDEKYCQQFAIGFYGAKNPSFRAHWLEDISLELHQRAINSTVLQKLIAETNFDYEEDDQKELLLSKFFEGELRRGNITIADLTGYYSSELEAVIATVKKIDEPTYEGITQKFKSVIDERQRAALKKLIIPELKPFPDLTGLLLKEQAIALKFWATDSFIPFKFYYDEAEELNDAALSQIEENANLFGDWLFKNVHLILDQDDIYTNIDIVSSIHAYLKDGNAVIWLIIDGLPAYYTADLERILQLRGINRIQKNWSFATLPTITEVAIPITISGTYGMSIDDSTPAGRGQLLNKAFPGYSTVYSAQPAEFNKSLHKNFDVCCLHARDIDTEMHKGANSFYDGRSAEIERLLNIYIEIIAKVIQQQPDRKLTLVVSTDHGATKCLTNAQMIKSPKLNELALSRPRERCIPLTEEIPPENWEKEGMYMLAKGPTRNKYDWVIARGYKYFGKNDSGYRHGGLTPEEVIVPVITAKILPVNAAKLTIRPVGTDQFRFGKTEKKFKFRVKNTNAATILISRVHILQEKDTFFNLPCAIAPGSEEDLTGEIKLHARLKPQSKNGIIQLNLSITYTLLGEQYEDVLRLELYTEKDIFENDFI